jgi:hypothetical protein
MNMDKITKKAHLIQSKIVENYNVDVSRNSTLMPCDLVLVMKGITTAFKINSKRLYMTKDFVPHILLTFVNGRSGIFVLQNL